MLSTLLTLAVAVCDAPTMTQVTVVPVGATREPVTNFVVPDITFAVTCPPVAGNTCTPTVNQVEALHPAAADKVIAFSVGGPAIASGGTATMVVPGSPSTYFGSTVVVRATFECGTGVARSSSVTTTSAPVVIAPHLRVFTPGVEITSWADLAGSDFPSPVAAAQVPANLRFTPLPMMLTEPRGTETATVRVAGPGLDFTKAYTSVGADGGVDSVVNLFSKDPASKLSVTGPGTGRAWVEYAGLPSEELALTFIAGTGGGAGGGSSATGGGSGATGGGGDAEPDPKPGCSVGGGAALAVLALVFARRR